MRKTKVFSPLNFSKFKMRKLFLFLLIAFFLLIFSFSYVLAFSGTSVSYSSDVKTDSVAETNAASSSFIQRFIGGINTVAQYISTSFAGRLGILEDSSNTVINFTYPINNQIIPRGNDAISGEDDKGVVSNTLDLKARVYTNDTNSPVLGAMCYFYDSATLIANATTNSSGDCLVSYTKSSESVGVKNLFVNYTLSSGSDDVSVIDESRINISIIRYVSTLSMDPSHSSKYYDGEVATLTIAINKINETGTFSYDPQNITVNATNAAQIVYNDGNSYYPGGNVTNTSVGYYSANVTVNYTFGAYVRWDVWLSDNGYISYLGSAVHSDVFICSNTGWSAWSDWSACVASSQTKTRTDSSSCVEIQTQTCTSGGDGGGGGGDEPPAVEICYNQIDDDIDGKVDCADTDCANYYLCGPEGLFYNNCNDNFDNDGDSKKDCADADCDNYPFCQISEICTDGFDNDGDGLIDMADSDCACIPNWQCSEWSDCFINSSSGAITGNAILNTQISKITGEAIFFDSNCEIIGEKRCHPLLGNYYRECSSKKKGVLIWESQRCGNGLVCSNGECACSLENFCNLEGEVKCTSDNKFQICKKDTGGCLKWSNDQKCSKELVCSNGECAKEDIPNVCELGEKSCIDDSVYFCSIKKGINNWVKEEDCNRKSICLNGECLLNSCYDGIKNYDEEAIDCGGSCQNCEEPVVEPIINQTEINQTEVNETVEIPDIEFIDSYNLLIGIGESRSFNINRGDSVYVTYEEERQDAVLLSIKKSEIVPPPEEVEIHTIRFDGKTGENIRVTVFSELITKEISLGETVVFTFETGEAILDFAGAIQTRTCVDLSGCNLTESKPPESRECGAESGCIENWYCEWTSCRNATYSYAESCVDLNNCGTQLDKPYKKECSCYPNFECENWSDCSVDYNLNDLLTGEPTLNGNQHRLCVDLIDCESNDIEWTNCSLAKPITTKLTTWCFKNYVEIYEVESNMLVSRIKETSVGKIKALNIGFIATEFKGYCDYCYDGVKNYDEEAIDCGGDNCPACKELGKFVDYLIYVKLILWIILFLLILYLIFANRKKISKSVKSLKWIDEEKLMKFSKRKLRAKVTKIRKPLRIKQFFVSLVGKLKRRRVEKKLTRQLRKRAKIEIREGKRVFKRERKVVRKEARVLKKRIRHKQISLREFPDLEIKLREWRRKGYIHTAGLHRKLDELKRKRQK